MLFAMAQQFSERIKVIDGLQSPDKINQQIITIIKNFIIQYEI